MCLCKMLIRCWGWPGSLVWRVDTFGNHSNPSSHTHTGKDKEWAPCSAEWEVFKKHSAVWLKMKTCKHVRIYTSVCMYIRVTVCVCVFRSDITHGWGSCWQQTAAACKTAGGFADQQQNRSLSQSCFIYLLETAFGLCLHHKQIQRHVACIHSSCMSCCRMTDRKGNRLCTFLLGQRSKCRISRVHRGDVMQVSVFLADLDAT